MAPSTPDADHTSAPFELHLALKQNEMECWLTNISSQPQWVLHHPLRQPVELRLWSEAGPVTLKDWRVVENYPREDREIRQAQYVQVRPGEKTRLGSGSFLEGDRGYDLQWGVFYVKGLKPGRYTAQAVWTSKHSDFEDGVLDGVWKGGIASEKVTIVLPGL